MEGGDLLETPNITPSAPGEEASKAVGGEKGNRESHAGRRKDRLIDFPWDFTFGKDRS